MSQVRKVFRFQKTACGRFIALSLFLFQEYETKLKSWWRQCSSENCYYIMLKSILLLQSAPKKVCIFDSIGYDENVLLPHVFVMQKYYPKKWSDQNPSTVGLPVTRVKCSQSFQNASQKSQDLLYKTNLECDHLHPKKLWHLICTQQ